GSIHSWLFFTELNSKSIIIKNNLIEFLKQKFPLEHVSNAEQKLMIFSTNDFCRNSICYPYINENGEVTGIKVMAYDVNGKRMKNNDGGRFVNWMHHIYKIENWVNDFCLFGLHQIKHGNEKVVHIVESEKTALI